MRTPLLVFGVILTRLASGCGSSALGRVIALGFDGFDPLRSRARSHRRR